MHERWKGPACPRAGDAVEYARGELAPARRASFERHVESCAACREELDDLSAVIAALEQDVRRGELRRARAEGASDAELFARIAARVPLVSRPLRASRRRAIAATAAAMAIAVALLGARQWLQRTPAPAPSGAPIVVANAGAANDLDAARDWLIAEQDAEGSWDPRRWRGEECFRVALTGLGAIALEGDPRPAAVVARRRAVTYLAARQDAEGRLGPGSRGALYNHAIGACALAGAARTDDGSADGDATPAAVRALDALARARLAAGGWGGDDRGTVAVPEVTIWAVEALRRGEAGGLGSRDTRLALDAGLAWLESVERAPAARYEIAATGLRRLTPDGGVALGLFSRAVDPERRPAGRRLLEGAQRRGIESPAAGAAGWDAAGGRLYQTALAVIAREASPLAPPKRRGAERRSRRAAPR